MRCRFCQTEIADKALICYRCGRATQDPVVQPPDGGSIFAHRRRSRMPLVIAIVVILLALLVAAWLLIGGDAAAPAAWRLDPPVFTLEPGPHGTVWLDVAWTSYGSL